MTIAQDAVQGLQKLSPKNSLSIRLSRVLNQYIVSDFRLLLQAGQSPAPLVFAAALGTILSFIPTPFLDSLLIGIITVRFRQINRAALFTARIIWNDFIVVPLYLPGFRFGMRLIQPHVINDSSLTIKILGFSLGLFLLTAAATIISTVMMLSFLLILQQWHRSPSRCCCKHD
jgi:hypothetical protein